MAGDKNFGERLKSLRVSLGMSLRKLSEKLEITAQTLSNYERGLTMPSSSIVIALSKELKVKTEYFFRPVTLSISVPDFRKKNSLLVKEQSSLMEKVKEWLERYTQVESLFSNQTAVSLPKMKAVDNSEQVEQAANDLRKQWHLGQAPIENMTSLLEENHIRVCFVDAPESFDACTFWVNDRPCIVARKDLPGDRLRFNLAHELGHALLHEGADMTAGDKEFEAESVSFAVLYQFGIDSKNCSFPYIASWKNGNLEECIKKFESQCERIQSAANKIIEMVENQISQKSEAA